MPSIEVRDQAHWHEIRAHNIGSSDEPALWGMSPYKTPYQLWHEKAGTLAEPHLDDNVRVLIGKHVETGIAKAIAEINGLQIRKVHRYITHPRIQGMGASLDYELLTEDAGWVPFEIKNVDRSIWFTDWLHEDNDHEPPVHIDIQVQHQMACTGKPYAFVGVMVGGNDPYMIRRDRHDGVVDECERRVHAFWQSIKDGHEPRPDYANDLDAMSRVYHRAAGVADMKGHDRLEDLLGQYERGAALAKEGEAIKTAAKAEMLDLIGEAEKVLLEGGSISAKQRPGLPERQVIFKASAPKREVRVYPKKKAAMAVAAE